MWNGQDKPPLPVDEALEGGKVRQRAFKSRVGHALILIDGSDEGLILETAGGHRLFLADEKKKVTLETTGGHKFTLDDSKSEITVESTANLTIRSGASLAIAAGSKLELKGATLSLNADTTGEVKAGVTLVVKGELVKFN